MTKINLQNCKGFALAAIDDGVKFIAGKNIKLFEKVIKVLAAGGKAMAFGSKAAFIDPIIKTSEVVISVLSGRKFGDSWQEARGEYSEAIPEKKVLVDGKDVTVPGTPACRKNPYQGFAKLHKFAFWSFAVGSGAQFVDFAGKTLSLPVFKTVAGAVGSFRIFGVAFELSTKALGSVAGGVGLIFTVADVVKSCSTDMSKIRETYKDSWKLRNKAVIEERFSRFLKVTDFVGKIGLITFSGAAFGITALSFAHTAPFIAAALAINLISLGSSIFEIQRKDKDSATNYWRSAAATA